MTTNSSSNVAATRSEKIQSATLLRSLRMTPETSPEEVWELKFRADTADFAAGSGQCLQVLAPGQFGNTYHRRLYSIADIEKAPGACAEFTLCVRRCFTIDDFNGEQYAGVASNYLCDRPIGGRIEFVGPLGYPFTAPADKRAPILMVGMGTGIAPFRGLVRSIYEKNITWEGKVRLFYGARSGLEMLYMNDENRDLANYFDQPTFNAFQAVSPRPVFDAPIALDQALEANATEVWSMLQDPATHFYLAGNEAMRNNIEATLSKLAGSPAAWRSTRQRLVADGRWREVVY